jgi:hypothetical protein
VARIRVFGRSAWLLAGLVLVTAGCSGGGPAGKTGAGGGTEKASDALASKIGDYMPPLDGGRLEIAAPKGWDWANPGGGVLVAFKPKDAEINALPRVLLSVADSDFAGIDDVTASNVDDFVRQVAASIADQKPKESARAHTVNGRQFARYLVLGKRRNQVVAQQFLTTVAGSRVYTLRLEAYQPQFDDSKSMLEAIAASMKFAGDEEPAAVPPGGEPNAGEDPAAETPDESPEEGESSQEAEPVEAAAKAAE